MSCLGFACEGALELSLSDLAQTDNVITVVFKGP